MASAALIRHAASRVLRGVRGGQLTIVDAEGTRSFGDTSGTPSLAVTVTVRSPSVYRDMLRGSRGLAEAYEAGDWDCDDLVGLVRIAARSLGATDAVRYRIARAIAPVDRIGAARRANSRSRSRDNVRRHYDLSNEFFSLVLDETMGYSCAYYERPDTEPVEASRANLERVCRILDLRPGDRLLELGSGWGGLAIHAARHHGARVSTVTISPSQRDYIEAAAAAAGVAGSVDVVMRDYRDLEGTWDKLVSLEMVESVGALHLDAFITQIGRLMRPDGLMLLQAITTHDKLFHIDRYRRTFLNQLIFPGGCVPSIEALTEIAARRTDLRVAAVYDITPHYPPTIRAWRERLERNWSRIERLGGFDDRFHRRWRLYFSWCEGAFLERRVLDRQIVFAGPRWRGENRLLGLERAQAAAATMSAPVAHELSATPR